MKKVNTLFITWLDIMINVIQSVAWVIILHKSDMSMYLCVVIGCLVLFIFTVASRLTNFIHYYMGKEVDIKVGQQTCSRYVVCDKQGKVYGHGSTDVEAYTNFHKQYPTMSIVGLEFKDMGK